MARGQGSLSGVVLGPGSCGAAAYYASRLSGGAGGLASRPYRRGPGPPWRGGAIFRGPDCGGGSLSVPPPAVALRRVEEGRSGSLLCSAAPPLVVGAGAPPAPRISPRRCRWSGGYGCWGVASRVLCARVGARGWPRG